MTTSIKFMLNGEETKVKVDPAMRVLDLLREVLNLTGTKEGCGLGECGACTILLDGKPVNSCLLLVGQIAGRSVTTIEGLSKKGKMDSLMELFIEKGAVQCGFCTPGMLLTCKALLNEPNFTLEEMKNKLSGNVCRCTGYIQIFDAVNEYRSRLRLEERQNNYE